MTIVAWASLLIVVSDTPSWAAIHRWTPRPVPRVRISSATSARLSCATSCLWQLYRRRSPAAFHPSPRSRSSRSYALPAVNLTAATVCSSQALGELRLGVDALQGRSWCRCADGS